MKKVMILSVVLVSLTGCSPTAEQLQQQKTLIESSLPPGCEFKYAGEYATYPVMFVYCDGKATTSVSTEHTESRGKTTAHLPSMVVVIEGQEYELKPKQASDQK